MQFYIKGENDEYIEAQDKVDQVISTRLSKYKESEAGKIRQEVESTLRKELEADLTKSLTASITAEYEPKLKDAETKINELDVRVRQKTIAAEYGFKPDLESFLGTGTDDEMKAKADILKENGSTVSTPPKKQTANENTNSFITLSNS